MKVKAHPEGARGNPQYEVWPGACQSAESSLTSASQALFCGEVRLRLNKLIIRHAFLARRRLELSELPLGTPGLPVTQTKSFGLPVLHGLSPAEGAGMIGTSKCESQSPAQCMTWIPRLILTSLT
jgi:hypothetical protein